MPNIRPQLQNDFRKLYQTRFSEQINMFIKDYSSFVIKATNRRTNDKRQKVRLKKEISIQRKKDNRYW
jgi:hypothetical protein